MTDEEFDEECNKKWEMFHEWLDELLDFAWFNGYEKAVEGYKSYKSLVDNLKKEGFDSVCNFKEHQRKQTERIRELEKKVEELEKDD